MIRAVARLSLRRLRELQNVLAVSTAVGILAVRPTSWPRTTRDVLSRQIMFTGVNAVGLIVAVACVMGVSMVLQAQLWLGRVGQRNLLGPLLVVVVVREVGPLLANLVVILRSAGAVAAEMANMKLSGEVHVLDAQGLDPLVYLVLPRVVAMVVATIGLAVTFVVVSLVTGSMLGLALGAQVGPAEFAKQVLRSVGPVDILNLVLKTVIPAAVTAVICCVEGLGVEAATTEVPRATSRGLERSVVALFVVTAAVSIMTYL